MILDQITLRDFGVYAGQQEIDLTPPSSDRPIVVFGGLNGTGKTTLMDALQLCLFGPAAKCVAHNGSGYNDFLARRIRTQSPSKQSSISVTLRCNEDNVETSYCVTRTWQHFRNGVKEKLKVTRDNCSEKSLSENWDQYINDIIPVNISHLFFFDGEKIATYATPVGVRELIANGVRNLFGIDVIERLQKDLRILERRQGMTMPSTDNAVVNQKEKELRSLRKCIALMKEKKSALEIEELNIAKDDLAGVLQEYRTLGGDFRDRHEEIQRRANQAKVNVNTCYDEMADIASTELPLLLVRELLQDVATYASKEQKIKQARATVENLHERDTRMFNVIQNLPNTSVIVEALKEFCRSDTEKQEKLASCKTLINLSDTDFVRLDSFLQDKLPRMEKNVRNLLTKFHISEDEMKAALLQQAEIPPEDVIDEITKKRDLLEAKITHLGNEISGLDSEIEKTNRECERIESEINTLLVENAKSEFTQKDIARFMQHSQLARQTLTDFGATVLHRQVEIVEHFALESYQCLLRKDRLITTLKINPDTFDIVLRDREQNPISVEQLSAGECQLLVVALLWGMAKASGKLLPVAIDTPMGRLDSTHRDRLVGRYFPNASHQLLLFTTDQEIDKDYMSQLRPWVGKSYYLNYNDTTGETVVSDRFMESV